MHNKRGASAVLIFRLIGLTLAVVVFITMLHYVTSVADDTTLERNAMARDIGLLLTTIYAAPGDLTYEYPINMKVVLEIGNAEVKVGEHEEDLMELNYATYWYAENPAFENPKTVIRQPDKLIFTKRGNKISVTGVKNE